MQIVYHTRFFNGRPIKMKKTCSNAEAIFDLRTAARSLLHPGRTFRWRGPGALAPSGDAEEKPCGRTYEIERDVFSNHAGTRENTGYRRVKWATRAKKFLIWQFRWAVYIAENQVQQKRCAHSRLQGFSYFLGLFQVIMANPDFATGAAKMPANTVANRWKWRSPHVSAWLRDAEDVHVKHVCQFSEREKQTMPSQFCMTFWDG